MTGDGFWEGLSNTRYFAILFIVIISFLILASLAIPFNTLWTIILALPYTFAIPIYYYIDARVEHKKLARFSVLFTFIFVLNTLFFTTAHDLIPSFSYFFATVYYITAFAVLMTITTILCEKYLKPRIITK